MTSLGERSPTAERRNSAVFRSSPLKPKTLVAPRTALTELSTATASAERTGRGPLREVFTSGSAALALEEALEALPDDVQQPSPAKKLLDAFRASPRAPSPRGSGGSSPHPASPLPQSPSTASLLLQNAISRPGSPISRAGSPSSVRSAQSVQSTTDEGPAFTFYEDPSDATWPDTQASSLLEDFGSEDVKENVAPVRPRRHSTFEVPAFKPDISPRSVPMERTRIPISLSTTDLPGAIGDVAPETRVKRPAGDDLLDGMRKRGRLEF